MKRQRERLTSRSWVHVQYRGPRGAVRAYSARYGVVVERAAWDLPFGASLTLTDATGCTCESCGTARDREARHDDAMRRPIDSAVAS